MSQHGVRTDGGDDALPYSTEIADDEDTVGAIVTAIAEVEGVEVLELDLTLYNFIDTDALKSLVENAPVTSETEVVFHVDGYRVSITGTGWLTIDTA